MTKGVCDCTRSENISQPADLLSFSTFKSNENEEKGEDKLSHNLKTF